ncbi:helix-turn-helix transcriptional regulator [uncultured Pseudoteredinibacter sp.]|uniref:helix-turn-helix transcriptional regulator n=1 Tax=uncultured Pseudoteredinibacter sp. TaxID=1641701 RepID=UPI002623916C|nr:helix-turn-helix transcriptional regulator [uncultured Pseudoteredinibacter sp.]
MHKNLHQGIELIYDSIHDQTIWPEVLQHIVTCSKSKGGVLMLEDFGGGNIYNEVNIGISDSSMENYALHYASVDFINKKLMNYDTHQFWRLSEIDTDNYYLKSELYADFCRPENIHHLAGGYININNTLATRLGLQRAHGEKDYSDEDIHFINQLNSHLKTAITLQDRLTGIHNHKNISIKDFDNIQQAIFLVDKKLKIYYQNEYSEAFSTHKEFSVFNGSLILDHALETQLRPIINHAIDAAQGISGFTMQNCIYIKEGNKKSHYDLFEILVLPFSTSDQQITIQYRKALAIILIRPIRKNTHIDSTDFAKLYSLTKKEACILTHISKARTINEISEHEKLSHNTIKTHIKALLRKTDCKNQTQLLHNLFKHSNALDIQI